MRRLVPLLALLCAATVSAQVVGGDLDGILRSLARGPVVFRALFSPSSAGDYATYSAEVSGASISDSRASSATYTGPDGGLQTATSNRLRIERLADGGGGLLVEGASTNLDLRSTDLSNAAWTQSNITVTANTCVYLDGSTTMAKLAGTGGTATTSQVVTVTSSTGPFTQSGDLAAVSGTQSGSIAATLSIGTISTCACLSSNPAIACTATVRNSSQTCEGNITATTTPTRVAVTFTTASAVTAFSSVAYPGTYGVSGGVNICASGMQAEVQAWASSRIPTAGTAVTRAADAVSAPNPLTGTGDFCLADTDATYAGFAYGGGAYRHDTLYGATSYVDWYDQTYGGGTMIADMVDNAAGLKELIINPTRTAGAYHSYVLCDAAGSASITMDGALQTRVSYYGSGTGIITQPPRLSIGGVAGAFNGYFRNVLACNSSNASVCK